MIPSRAMKKFILPFLLVLLAALTLINHRIEAQTQTYDRKVYPATMCQATPDWYNNAGAINTFPGLTGYEEISTLAPAGVVVLVCPIVRDNVSNTNGMTIKVYAHDTDPNADIQCSAVSASPYQDSYTQTSYASSGIAFAGGNVLLNIPFLGTTYDGGPVNVVCALGSTNTQLMTYYAREFLPTDGEP